MSRHHVLLLFLGAFSSLASGRQDPPSTQCVMALYGVYANIRFAGSDPEKYWSLCQNPLTIVSIYAGAHAYCNPDDIEPGKNLLAKYCHDYGESEVLPESDFAANLTQDSIKSLPVIKQDEVTPTDNFTTPVLIDRAWFEISYRTVTTWDFEMKTHTDYGWAMYGFWGTVLLVGMVQNLFHHLTNTGSVPTQPDVENGGSQARTNTNKTKSPIQSAYDWTRTHVTMPGVIPDRHRQLTWGCTFPTRVDTFVIGSFWLVSFLLCCVNYDAFQGNLYWADTASQVWRYVADRTGIIAYANLPFIWVFGVRNNIFLWATGWQFSRFNLYHRHIARVATLQAIIHSIGYTVFYFLGDPTGAGFRLAWKEPWFYLGVVATIVMSLIVAFSFSWFRNKIYEAFLMVHIIFSIVTIIGLFYHTSIFDGEYDAYLWPLVAIWGFDRLLRIIRLIYCNVHVTLKEGKGVSFSEAIATYDVNGNMIRVEVSLENSHLVPAPGQHYYLYQLGNWRLYENHPFTLAYWGDASTPASPVGGISKEEGSSSPTDSVSRSNSLGGADMQGVAGVSRGAKLVFFVRPCDGWTRRLRDECTRSPDNTTTPKILVEGPYGTQEKLWMYDRVLLVAGGSGIAAILPYLLDHVQRRAASDAKCRTQRVSVVWADRSETYMRTVAVEELAIVAGRSDTDVSLYVTRGKTKIDGNSDEKEVGGAGQKSSSASESGGDEEQSAMLYGRPDLRSIIAKLAQETNEERLSAAVLACGPPVMADTVRSSIVEARRTYNSSIDYFEESFGW